MTSLSFGVLFFSGMFQDSESQPRTPKDSERWEHQGALWKLASLQTCGYGVSVRNPLRQCWMQGKKCCKCRIQSQQELKLNKNPFTAKRLSPQSCPQRWVPPEHDASQKQTNSQYHQGSLRCCRDVLETQLAKYASLQQQEMEHKKVIGVTELWTFRITGHRDAEVITEILVDAPGIFNSICDGRRFWTLGSHTEILVMSWQVVDKELHQIQSAAETTLCGSPLLLACTESWTSVNRTEFFNQKPWKKTTHTHTHREWQLLASWRITAQCDNVTHTEPQCRTMRACEHETGIGHHPIFESSTRCFLQSFRAFRVILVPHQGMSWGVLIAVLNSFWVQIKQARGIFSNDSAWKNFTHENC